MSIGAEKKWTLPTCCARLNQLPCEVSYANSVLSSVTSAFLIAHVSCKNFFLKKVLPPPPPEQRARPGLAGRSAGQTVAGETDTFNDYEARSSSSRAGAGTRPPASVPALLGPRWHAAGRRPWERCVWRRRPAARDGAGVPSFRPCEMKPPTKPRDADTMDVVR